MIIPDKDQILRILTFLNKLDSDISVFDSLPVEMIKNIMENLDCKSMLSIYKLSNKLSKVCKQENIIESILKDKFTKLGYNVKDFNLNMLQYTCLVLNRGHPTMTGYSDKLYILNNNNINIINFDHDLENFEK